MLIQFLSYSSQPSPPSITLYTPSGGQVGSLAFPSTLVVGNLYQASVPLSTAPVGFYWVVTELSAGTGTFAIEVVDDVKAIVGSSISELEQWSLIRSRQLATLSALSTVQSSLNGTNGLFELPNELVFIGASGLNTPTQTVYGFPVGGSYANWDTLKVPMTAGSGSQNTVYRGDITGRTEPGWLLYLSASAPTPASYRAALAVQPTFAATLKSDVQACTAFARIAATNTQV